MTPACRPGRVCDPPPAAPRQPSLEAGSAAMNPILLIPGVKGLLAPGPSPRKARGAATSPPADAFFSDPGHCPDIDCCSLSVAPGGSEDADTSVCKLSLTCDEARHPRVHKGPFGYEFEPFM